MLKSGSQEASDAAGERLGWRSCPLVDQFPRSLLLVGACVAVCVLAAIAFDAAGYALLSAALLAVSLARYLLPTGFELDEHGVTVRFLGQARKVPWSQVRRILVQPRGVFLSPFRRPSRLDSFRGTFLRFAGKGENADEVVSFVQDRVAMASQAG